MLNRQWTVNSRPMPEQRGVEDRNNIIASLAPLVPAYVCSFRPTSNAEGTCELERVPVTVVTSDDRVIQLGRVQRLEVFRIPIDFFA